MIHLRLYLQEVRDQWEQLVESQPCIFTIKKIHFYKPTNQSTKSKKSLNNTCFHFNSLFETKDFFFTLNNEAASKLSSLSLLVDTTRIATLLVRKNRKSSNIDPHFFTYFCTCFLLIKDCSGRSLLHALEWVREAHCEYGG